MNCGDQTTRFRGGAILVGGAVLLLLLISIVAIAVDVGRLVLVRTQLQTAADSAAMAAAEYRGGTVADATELAQQFAGRHVASGKSIDLDRRDVEFGVWDATDRTFTPTGSFGNAVRVTTRRDSTTNGRPDFLFARILGNDNFAIRTSAVAMANPRDIAFVVDLSGSMNDDTEPVWATDTINKVFQSSGDGKIGDSLVEKLFADLGFGAYPGNHQYVGEPLGVRQDRFAYAEMTKDAGPLSRQDVPLEYRISPLDPEPVRKRKAYRWMMDRQIAEVMPEAKPAPNSGANYGYWEKYLDYIIEPGKVEPRSVRPRGSSGGGVSPPASGPPEPSTSAAGLLIQSPGSPPNDRGWLPPNQDSDRIHRFDNPNKGTFSQASTSGPETWRNKIGYVTYAQFMLDHGRDLKPDGQTYTPISQHSPDCPYHAEETRGGLFRFPPRSQPMHASRRALIAAINAVQNRNKMIPDPKQRDWVSIISFDSLSNGGADIQQPLTGDYHNAMEACTELQAVGDKGGSTATEAGMIAARFHLRSEEEGGQGRKGTNKIVVLLTDGVPDQYSSDARTIDQFMTGNPSNVFYKNGSYECDAPLMQAVMMQAENWYVFPVGVGLGTDYGFMDRLARTGASADDNGESPRGSGNPAEYEERLTEIFLRIINAPKVRLVE